MDKAHRYWLLAIFLITVAARLAIAFAIPHFTYDSYFHLRQVEHITETGFPLYKDDLSYGGRLLIFLPLFHYLAAFFDLFLPLELVAKILPNLLLSTLTLLAYLISKKITSNTTASLLAALTAGFLPVLFHPNSFTATSLFLPLLFLLIYAFLNLKDQRFIYIYITAFLLLSFTSAATILIIIGFGLYVLLSLLEGKHLSRAELELMVFSIFFFIWSQFLFFKNVFIMEGIAFIWRNIPPQVIFQYFPSISLLQALVLVSIIPFLAGIYVVYRSMFRLKAQRSFLLISLVISTTLLAWLRLLEFKLSLSFFGIILAILFASFYQESVQYLNRTKVARLKNIYLLLVIALIIASTIYPAVASALTQDIPSKEDVNAFQWLQENTPATAGVAALLEEGHLVTYAAQRRNLMDNQFGLINNVEQRFADLDSLYTARFQTQALEILDRHNIHYIMVTARAQERFSFRKFTYATPACFRKVYDEGPRIYKVTCSLHAR